VIATEDRAGPVVAPIARMRRLRSRLAMRWFLWVEGALVAAAPAFLTFALRIRVMAPTTLPDASMHTTYIIDPRDFLSRYSGVLASVSGTREGARVGFLVPARIAYLMFGAVPGFFVTRYALVLVAIVPAYLLLRRLYGRAAGPIAIAVIMSCPVIITAWGSDYPDSAVVSYAIGALACLAMPSRERWRVCWVAAAGAIMAMAVWADVVAVPIVLITLLLYAAVSLRRYRQRPLREVAALAVAFGVVTGVLVIASGLLLDRFNFIGPTLGAYSYLSSPAVVVLYHSNNWHWVLYRSYLLVPIAVIGGFGVTFFRGREGIATPQLLVGLVCGGQIVVCCLFQFFGNAELLEEYFYSSALWGCVCVALAVTIAHLSRPLLARRATCWLPAFLVLVVPRSYEADPHVPAFGWMPWGFIMVAILVAAIWLARYLNGGRIPSTRTRAQLFSGLGVVVAMSCVLMLTVAPEPVHPKIAGAVRDPAPPFAGALGGNASVPIARYQIASELPAFVGKARYEGEQLLMWYPKMETVALVISLGIYHSNFNSIPSPFPRLTPTDIARIRNRKPPQILLLSNGGRYFSVALRVLQRYDPVVLKKKIFRSGPVTMHVWLVGLGVFQRP
jgi:hypothetical protein